MTKPSFKQTRFYVANQEEGRKLQEAMFTLGFKWASDSEPGARRIVRNYFAKGGWLYVDKDCRMTQTVSEICRYEPYASFKSTFQQAIFAAAAVHKVVKRAERKASRKRKAQRRLEAEGWIFPVKQEDVPQDVHIDMLLKDGSELTNFVLNIVPFNVVRYRFSAVKPKTVTLEAMVDDIVQSAGGKEVLTADSEGFISWTPGFGFKWGSDEPGWSGNLPKGTLIDVKYRNGGVRTCMKAGIDPDASGAFWRHDGMGADIVAYRVVPTINPAVPAPAFVPVEQVTAPRQQGTVTADTNPKRQYGVSSVPLNMWSPLASAYGALGLYNGALKYGKANFANTPVEASIYIAAAFRHLSAWASGQEFDPADGVPNLGGVLANIAIILEARAAGTLIDDRLRMDGYLKEIDALKEIVKSLNELHAGKNPKHYTLEAQ